MKRDAHSLRSATCTLFLALSAATLTTGCGGDDGSADGGPSDIWDIDRDGIPQFVAVDYIEPAPIGRISKFRSSVGHDYSDAFEDCRSMKHYFEPKPEVDWSTIKVFAPVAGTITRVEPEAVGGTKVEIVADAYPAFRFSIFHVSLSPARQVNDHVTEGEQLGTHVGTQTMSDISVIVNDPTRQGRMISYFETMTDELFASYTARGVENRAALVISKPTRDQSPLTCNGDTFTSIDPLEAWVTLQ